MLLERIRILTDEKEQTNEIRRYLYRVIEQIEDELNRMDGTGNGAEDAKAYTDKMISELEIPSLEGYATETYVTNAISNAVPDLSIIGDTDISEIDDGTLTGAVAYLNSMLGDVASVLDAVNRTVV